MGFTRKFDRSFLLSILLHAAFLLVWGVYAVSNRSLTAPQAPKYVLIEVDPILKPSAKDSKNTQVVQTEKAHESKTATPDAFLGERTQIAEKQTTSLPKTGDAATTSKANSQKKNVAVTEPAAPVAPDTGAVIRSDGALARFGIAIDASKNYAPKAKAKSLLEEASLTAQARGEYVKGFKEGEETMLNTKEFVFYGYFQRLRERLDRAWEKSLRQQLTRYFHRGRQLASEMDYQTQLLVSLDSKGRIIRVQVVGASGTKDLDDAAVKAFNEAGPFPNPPQGLVQQGQVHVRWDFVLKT
jgi:protein TonB